MPLSFRRSYKKLPAADLDGNTRSLAKTPSKKSTIEIPADFRPRRYPAVIPIGCGLAAGVCLFALISQRFIHLPSISTGKSTDVIPTTTATAETMLAREAGASEDATPSDTPTFVPIETQTPAPVEVASPANPWAADIPDAACIPADLPQTGRVVDVLDGDTIKVLLDADGRVYSVRYLGVEAPAPREGSAGIEALAQNSQLVYRKQAVMVRDITDSDASGTLLRYVLAEGVFVNHALIEGGLAAVGMNAPDTACLQTLLAAEQQAQAEARGIWRAALAPTSIP